MVPLEMDIENRILKNCGILAILNFLSLLLFDHANMKDPIYRLAEY